MMRSFTPVLLSAAAALGFFTTEAHAVLIGGLYDVDPTRAVSSLGSYSGSFSTNSHSYADIGALDDNWGGIYDGDGTADRRLNFLGADPGGPNPNTLLNGAFEAAVTNGSGIDIIAFESGDVPSTLDPADLANTEIELLAASLDGSNGTWVDFQVIGFLTDAQVGGSSTSFGVYVFGLDLDALGVAGGGSVSSLYFGNTASYLDHDPDIVWVGAGNVVPEPSTLLLLSGGLLAMGLRRRSR